jgi:hypothetical protein
MHWMNALQWPAMVVSFTAAGGLAEEEQTQLGILGFSLKQRVVDDLGMAR